MDSKENTITILTKAETLQLLKGKSAVYVIPKGFYFNEKEWFENKLHIIQKIKIFKKSKKKLILRSSAYNEDRIQSSLAGKYRSVVIKNENLNSLIDYMFSQFQPNKLNQVLVQEFIEKPLLSGVLFSRDVKFGAPYYVIEIDRKTKTTDQITSGKLIDFEKYYIVRNYGEKFSTPEIRKILKATVLCEKLLNNDCVDIEFAIKDNKVYIFQVRPLYIDSKIKIVPRNRFYKNIRGISNQIELLKKKNSLNIWTRMSDWNIVELIGKNPLPLTSSMFNLLIMEGVWKKARTDIGYSNTLTNKLSQYFISMPFIKVYDSFYSLIPNNLSKNLKFRLIRYYIDRLLKNPNLHDKIEFDVIYSIGEVLSNNNYNNYRKFGFHDDELKIIKCQVTNVFNNIINQKYLEHFINIAEASIQKIKSNQEIIKTASLQTLKKNIYDYKKNLIYSFCGIARCAFLLKEIVFSLQKKKLLNHEMISDIYRTLNTRNMQFVRMLNDRNIVDEFGSIRPDMFNYLSKPLRNDISLINNDYQPGYQSVSYSKPTKIEAAGISMINDLFISKNIKLNYESLLYYFTLSTFYREHVKFYIGYLIDMIFDWIEFNLEEKLNLTPETIAFLKVSDILNGNKCPIKLQDISRKRQNLYEISLSINLPDVLMNNNDVFSFTQKNTTPNFVTTNKAVGELVFWSPNHRNNIQNKIVLLERADPGFDWIFRNNIKGFITAYGGCNSHMAIRAQECNLPAILGIGISNFEKAKNFKNIKIDCSRQYFELY